MNKFLKFLYRLFTKQRLSSGIVTNKWYCEKLSYKTRKPVQSGRFALCVPFQAFEPEKWGISVKGESNLGDTIELTYYISEEEYNNITIGTVIDVSNFSNHINIEYIELIGHEN